jgi:hypothetical protein
VKITVERCDEVPQIFDRVKSVALMAMVRQKKKEKKRTIKGYVLNDSIHLKDLETSKYKRESKAQMPIQFVV